MNVKRAPLISDIQSELVVANDYGCLKWPKATMRNSTVTTQTAYLDYNDSNTRMTLARAQYSLKTNYIFQEGDTLCHRCHIDENRIVIEYGWCLNYKHMFIGTNADNLKDFNSKRRGDNNSHARKVINLATNTIYNSYESAAKDCGIESKWDVKYSCFSKIGKAKMNDNLRNRLKGNDFSLLELLS